MLMRAQTGCLPGDRVVHTYKHLFQFQFEVVACHVAWQERTGINQI